MKKSTSGQHEPGSTGSVTSPSRPGSDTPGTFSRRAALKLGPLVSALSLSAFSGEALAAEAIPRVAARAFGAVGDGVADDTAALRAALAASRCGELTHGTYRINGPLPIDGHQILLGCGSTLVGAGNHVGIRRGRDPRFGRRFIEFPVIRDLRLEGFSIGLDATGMSWGNFQNLVTARCGIGYRLPTGHLGTCYYNTFTSCHVVEEMTRGIVFRAMRNARFKDPVTGVPRVVGPNGNLFQGCKIGGESASRRRSIRPPGRPDAWRCGTAPAGAPSSSTVSVDGS